jgi:hypothetical protein
VNAALTGAEQGGYVRPSGRCDQTMLKRMRMVLTDSGRLRIQAIELLINALDAKTSLGVIEFGSNVDPATPAADVVFKVRATTIGSGQPKVMLTTQVSQSRHR